MTYNEYYDYDEPDYDADRQRAVAWAKTVLEQPFLILDTETTGLDDSAEAIEIAVIDRDGVEVFNSRIKPVNSIPQSAINIHGITNKDVENAPTFVEIYPKLKPILESDSVIIYNSAFDYRILNQQCKLNNLPPIELNTQCAMNWYSEYCGDWNEYYQSYTLQRLPGGDHSAFGDCQATLSVIKEMAGVK